MTRSQRLLWTVTSGVMLLAAQTIDAKQQSSPRPRPGIGVSGIGVTSVFVPAPGVPTPTVRSSNVTTPMVTATPGVTSRNVTTPQIIGAPGMAAPGVNTQAVTAAPGVATRAPATTTLPRGSYTAIPSTAVEREFKGITCYYADGVYYRPEYYMGSLVYVVVAQ